MSKLSTFDSQGDSSILHCVSLLHTKFAPLACANQRVHIQNKRNFPQAKLDSEINARFLLNGHDNVYFLCIIIVYIVSSLIKRKTNTFYREEKKIQTKGCIKPLLCDAYYDRENNDSANALRLVVLNSVMFPQILNDIVLCARHFLPVKFFPKYYFYKLCFKLSQNVTWSDEHNNAHDQHEYRLKWGKIGTSHLLNENNDLSCLLFFETVLGREHLGKISK